jgi:ATP-binding cassette subfamily B protein
MNNTQNKVKTSVAMGKLIAYIFKNFTWQFLVILFCLAIFNVVNMMSSIFLYNLIQKFIIPSIDAGTVEPYLNILYTILAVMIGVYVLGLIATITYTQIMARLGQSINNKIRKEMFDKMESLPIKYFDTHERGDIMSFYTNDVDTLNQFVGNSLFQAISQIIAIVTVFFIMLYYSFLLAAVVMLGTLLMVVLSRFFGKKSVENFKYQQAETGVVEGYIEEIMNGLRVVKVFNHEEKVEETFDKKNEKLFKVSNHANFFSSALMPVLGNVGNMIYVVVAIVGSIFIFFRLPNVSFTGYHELMEAGVAVSFLTMTRQFTMNISFLSNQTGIIAQASAGANRIFNFLNEGSEKDDGYVTLVNVRMMYDGSFVETKESTNMWAWKHPHHMGGVTYTPLKGEIVLDHVDFAYEEGKPILHDISIDAKAGKQIALVGATGAGKTTITNLLNRFYDIQDGKIRYDGININKIKKPDLRRSLGMVLQDTNLFDGTVKENIKYGKLDATDEEVHEAAKIANAYEFIMRLPQGFDTALQADGADLSQGQRQLISIARCAIANTPAMILDEATSSIDTRTEQLVQKGTSQLMKGRTVFVIAHRLSTVQNSDDIVVLSHGRIIEEGTHSKLIAKKGVYYQLYTGAFELE